MSRFIPIKDATKLFNLKNVNEILEFAEITNDDEDPLIQLYFDSSVEKKKVELLQSGIFDLRTGKTSYLHCTKKQKDHINRCVDLNDPSGLQYPESKEAHWERVDEEMAKLAETHTVTLDDIVLDRTKFESLQKEKPDWLKRYKKILDSNLCNESETVTNKEHIKLLRIIGLLTEALADSRAQDFRHKKGNDVNYSALCRFALNKFEHTNAKLLTDIKETRLKEKVREAVGEYRKLTTELQQIVEDGVSEFHES